MRPAGPGGWLAAIRPRKGSGVSARRRSVEHQTAQQRVARVPSKTLRKVLLEGVQTSARRSSGTRSSEGRRGGGRPLRPGRGSPSPMSSTRRGEAVHGHQVGAARRGAGRRGRRGSSRRRPWRGCRAWVSGDRAVSAAPSSRAAPGRGRCTLRGAGEFPSPLPSHLVLHCRPQCTLFRDTPPRHPRGRPGRGCRALSPHVPRFGTGTAYVVQLTGVRRDGASQHTPIDFKIPENARS